MIGLIGLIDDLINDLIVSRQHPDLSASDEHKHFSAEESDFTIHEAVENNGKISVMRDGLELELLEDDPSKQQGHVAAPSVPEEAHEPRQESRFRSMGTGGGASLYMKMERAQKFKKEEGDKREALGLTRQRKAFKLNGSSSSSSSSFEDDDSGSNTIFTHPAPKPNSRAALMGLTRQHNQKLKDGDDDKADAGSSAAVPGTSTSSTSLFTHPTPKPNSRAAMMGLTRQHKSGNMGSHYETLDDDVDGDNL
jgi:hypothetical protein